MNYCMVDMHDSIPCLRISGSFSVHLAGFYWTCGGYYAVSTDSRIRSTKHLMICSQRSRSCCSHQMRITSRCFVTLAGFTTDYAFSFLFIELVNELLVQHLHSSLLFVLLARNIFKFCDVTVSSVVDVQ